MSEKDAPHSEPFRQILEQAPIAFAITRGTTHELVYVNAAFRAIPGIVGVPTPGRPVADLFHATVTNKITPLLERAMREGFALCNQMLGSLEQGGRPWSCCVWPLLHDAQLPPGLVIELTVATHTQRTFALQREVAERLVLSALRESEAAASADASQKRAAFLAHAGQHLAESVDTEQTRKIVAGLTLSTIAEWCIVDLVNEDDTLSRLAIVHREPSMQALVNQLESRWLPKTGDPFGVPAVLNNPQPVMIADDIDEALRTAAHNSENLDVLRQLGIGPLLTVPLIASTKVIGAITFVSRAHGRPFTIQEIELAEGLAARSGLALENARLYGDALVLKEKAEAAAKAATHFLGNVSHELRTPLNAILGYVELIAEGIHGPVTEAQQDDLERIAASQRHLLGIIGELLNFIRVGSGPIHYEAIDVPLKSALTHAVEILEPLLRKKGVAWNILEGDGHVAALADPNRLHQILVNLISNAMKFTDPGGEITIGFQASGDDAVITVGDNGRGIPSDKLDLIFEPFIQAQDEDATKHGGVGLGLPISRNLARAMGGELKVKSTLGSGSAFTLTLPIARSDRRTPIQSER
jgi:signal transduction histidine kinase